MRQLVFGLIVLLVAMQTARADRCDNYKSPAQVLAGLNSEDPIIQLAAKTCGLQSDDVAVRGVILKSIISGLNTMAFDLTPVRSDEEGAKLIDRMPQFGISNVSWNKDGRSFSGMGMGGNLSSAFGQLIGESLGIAFYSVQVQPDKPGGQVQVTTCTATLNLPKGGSSLTGTLHCTGFAPRFVISLGL